MKLNYNDLLPKEPLINIQILAENMIVINQKGIVDQGGRLRLDVSTHLSPGVVEIVAIIAPVLQDENRKKYDFSDLVGRLEWQGDPVKEQRKIRDE